MRELTCTETEPWLLGARSGLRPGVTLSPSACRRHQHHHQPSFDVINRATDRRPGPQKPDQAEPRLPTGATRASLLDERR